MKKKWAFLGVIGISGAAMLASGYTALASTSGYDVYKTALKNSRTLTSVAVSGSAQIQDNGTMLLNAGGNAKVGIADRTGSGTVTIEGGGSKQVVNVYKQAGQTVVKTDASDVYNVEKDGGDRHKSGKAEAEKQIPQEVENIIDTLVGNLKNEVNVTDQGNGAKQVTLQLTDSQIPSVLNAVGSLMVKNAVEKKGHEGAGNGDQGELQVFNSLKSSIPQLTQEIKIEQVSVTADINAANYIEHQVADITVSGKDASNVAHRLTLHLNSDMSGFNSTTPDAVDLTGKNVKVVEHKGGKHDSQDGQSTNAQNDTDTETND